MVTIFNIIIINIFYTKHKCSRDSKKILFFLRSTKKLALGRLLFIFLRPFFKGNAAYVVASVVDFYYSI